MDDSLYKSNLIDLQEIDTKIDGLLLAKESSDEVLSLKNAEMEFLDLQKRFSQISEELKPYYKMLEEHQSNIDKYQLNLDSNLASQSNTNVPSELTNYINQQQEFERNIKKIEGEIELLSDNFSEQLTEESRADQEIISLKEHLIKESKNVMKFWEQIERKIASLEDEKEKVKKDIPSKFVERYEELRKTEKVVVGYLNEEQCGICGFVFSSQELSKIENKEEDQCSSCRGILI